ncbi:retropepsin-like aspartic protease family protein [Usitatibacter palustris]|uniref:TIGR02281 family clan AA aspartic protease n=1 Tax=Usitatibacter palustris TaxID=2732487 RepID=A0A6M4HA33_9PROT|nr:TIGR02281 family clan AA aspartic protease [Usitatibacter palustris]QJR16401.1 hypothetical protein DSM104440_03235 [Usitatibacter palustris]
MKRHLIFATFTALLGIASAFATEVNVIGLFPGKAVVTINRGAPRTLSVGQKTLEGVVLVAVDAKGATLEVDGKKQTLEIGQHFESAAQTGSRTSVTLAPDSRGHYFVDGQVNGVHQRFLVDTGATLVSMGSDDASRLGIDYKKGAPGYSVVADGRRVPIFLVKLDSIRIGDVTLFNVDASVKEGPGMGAALLGMSFLNRTEMVREGSNLVLTKRF